MTYPHCWILWHCERKYPRLRSKGMWSEGQYRGPVSKIKHLRARRKIPSGLRAKFQPAARARTRVRPSTPGQACRGGTPRSQAAPGGGVRLSRPARPAPRERGRREAWPAAGPSRALPPPSPTPSFRPSSPGPELTSGVATRISATDHTFLAKEAEEGLVLLRGEQQGPHVGDPPRRRRLLLAGAHDVAGGAGSPGPSPAASGRSLVPPRGDRGGGRAVRGAASRSSSGAGRRRRPREGEAHGAPRRGKNAPRCRPTRLPPMVAVPAVQRLR